MLALHILQRLKEHIQDKDLRGMLSVLGSAPKDTSASSGSNLKPSRGFPFKPFFLEGIVGRKKAATTPNKKAGAARDPKACRSNMSL